MDSPATEPLQGSNESRRNATVISVVILVVSGLVAYSNSYSGRFVFDDEPTIMESKSIKSLWPIWPVLFEGEVTALGRPLVNLSFAINYAFGGLNVTSYHITNVILHLQATLALFGIVRRTLERSSTPPFLKDHATVISMFCSLIWMLHPLQTESVTYVVQRSESLVGLFYFLTLYGAIRATTSRRPRVWNTAAFAACLCGVSSKEVMVSAPLAVIVYDWAFPSTGFRRQFHRRRWLYVALFCTWIPLGLFVAQGRHDSAGFGHGLSSWEYGMTQFDAIVRYLRLTLWPDALVLDYGVGVTRDPDVIIPAAVLVGLLICGSLIAIKFQPWIAFLGFLFFASLSPSSSVVPIVTQTVAEHRMYLPLAAIVVLAVVTSWLLWQRILRHSVHGTLQSQLNWLIPSLCWSLVAVFFCRLTLNRNFEYANPVRLWTSNVQRCPDSLRPYLQIAKEYIDTEPRTSLKWYERAAGGYDLARKRNRVTHLMDIHLASSHFGRATMHARLKEFEVALIEFDRALKLDPSLVNGYFYRGMVLSQVGRDEEALASISKAIELEPTSEQLFIRGEILGKLKRYPEAVAEFSKGIEWNAKNPYLYQSRGRCLVELGQYQLALSDLNNALRLQPQFAKAFYERGRALAAINRHGNAIDDFSKAISLAPDIPEIYLNRSKSFISTGNMALARQDLNTLEARFAMSSPELRKQIDDLSAKLPAQTRNPAPSP